MILILSETHEESTDQVLEWLMHYKVPFVRINQDDKVELQQLYITQEGLSFTLLINNERRIRSADIKAFWYRRGYLHFDYALHPEQFFSDNTQLAQAITQNLYNEMQHLKALLYGFLDSRAINNTFALRNNNKLQHLQLAASLGLDTPATLVTQQKKALQLFWQQHKGNIIVKPNSSGFFFKAPGEDGQQYDHAVYTNTISAEAMAHFPEQFFPTLFQQLLEKRVELRVFYLSGKLYPMAIFSQADKQTELDFRRYNLQRPNRNVPFRLPARQQQLIRRFMRAAQLESGSLDLVLGTDGRYYFLEVNPVGQYGFTGVAGNYPLDQLIALQIKKEYEKETVS
jgi:ATP-GRASP peptide maturase of grasp-with-spasm system